MYVICLTPSAGLQLGNVYLYVPNVGSMNRSFLELSKVLSDLTILSTISAYEPDNDFDTRNRSFRIDSIDVKNNATACVFCVDLTDFFSYT